MNANPYSAPVVQDHPTADESATVAISGVWVRRINSPIYFVVAALTGVAVTFVPMALLALGIKNEWDMLTVAVAALCFAIVYAVPLFYIRLAGEVIRQIHRKSPACVLSAKPAVSDDVV